MSQYRAFRIDLDGHFHSSVGWSKRPEVTEGTMRQSPWLMDATSRYGSGIEKSLSSRTNRNNKLNLLTRLPPYKGKPCVWMTAPTGRNWNGVWIRPAAWSLTSSIPLTKERLEQLIRDLEEQLQPRK